MQKLNSTTGIIGFFDILGYENYLHRNDPKDAARTVLTFLPQAGETIVEKIVAMFPANNRLAVSERLKCIHWTVFSDTILANMSFSEPSLQGITPAACETFTTVMATFCRQMFDAGLSVRGVITLGEYVFAESCFAGKCIVDAYRFSKQLELAACVVHPEYQAEYEKYVPPKSDDPWLVRYQIPTKDEYPERLIALNYSALPVSLIEDNWSGRDIREIVAVSFGRHNKDVPPNVMKKLENTEMLIRHFKARFNHKGLFH